MPCLPYPLPLSLYTTNTPVEVPGPFGGCAVSSDDDSPRIVYWRVYDRCVLCVIDDDRESPLDNYRLRHCLHQSMFSYMMVHCCCPRSATACTDRCSRTEVWCTAAAECWCETGQTTTTAVAGIAWAWMWRLGGLEDQFYWLIILARRIQRNKTPKGLRISTLLTYVPALFLVGSRWTQ